MQEAQRNFGDADNLHTILRFLFNAGFHQEILSLTAGALEEKTPILWDLLIEILGKSQLEIPKSVQQSINKGLRRQKAEVQIWSTTALDALFPEFKDFRLSLAESFKHQEQERRDELLEKFEFLRNQRLEREARQVLRILKATFPEDTEIARLSLSFEENRAREVLNDFMHTSEQTKTHIPRFSKEELEFLKVLKESAKEEVLKRPELRLDVCFFFMFLDDFESALTILDLEAHHTFAEAWLRAELLKSGRRFVEALEQADRIAVQFQNDSETLIATTYFRAEVFGDMGQISKAIELLENISQVRPQYRSTSHLLQTLKAREFRQ